MNDGFPFPDAPTDLALIRGQEDGKRAIEIAAAGGHAIRMVGPVDTGAALLARALHPLLPPLGAAEAAEVARIHAAAGLRAATDPAAGRRPLCGPPPTITAAALFGSGAGRGRPGAVSLAHHGVLLLADLPAFGNHLARLAAILDGRSVTMATAGGRRTLPAAFQLVATARPCPCGWHGSAEHACACTPAEIRRFQRRVPAALHARIALHVPVPPVRLARPSGASLAEPSATVAARVAAARQIQAARFAAVPGVTTNAAMGPAEIRAHCALDGAGQALMQAAKE